jgi:myo-inositol-1-phosphate synthase
VVCRAGSAACGHGVRELTSLRDGIDAIRRDIQRFRQQSGASEIVIVDVSPTAAIPDDSDAHRDLECLERALDGRDVSITPNMLYFYAACKERCGFVNFTPNPTETPALVTLARKARIPFAGRDGKTGQTSATRSLRRSRSRATSPNPSRSCLCSACSRSRASTRR